MFRVIGLLCMVLLLVPTVVSAHIQNEYNLYEDIQYSTAKDAIVYLNGLGVINTEHGVSLFKPSEKLSRNELAVWAGKYLKVLDDAEATSAQIAEAALEQGLVTSLEGNATYQEVSQAYFQGKVKMLKPNDELTREEFAECMATYLDENENQPNLFELAGFTKGPSGLVEEVELKQGQDAEGNEVDTVYLKVGETEVALSAHPRVINGMTSTEQWIGENITESWFMGSDGENKQLQLITFDKPATDDNGSLELSSEEHADHHKETSSGAVSKDGFPYVPLIIMAALILLIGWLFRKRKTPKSNA